MQGLLQAAPIGLGDQHGVAALTGDMDGLMGRSIDKSVKLGASLGGGNVSHGDKRTQSRTLGKNTVAGVMVE